MKTWGKSIRLFYRILFLILFLSSGIMRTVANEYRQNIELRGNLFMENDWNNYIFQKPNTYFNLNSDMLFPKTGSFSGINQNNIIYLEGIGEGNALGEVTIPVGDNLFILIAFIIIYIVFRQRYLILKNFLSQINYSK